MGSITVDNFAGGGGASAGIEAALGRPVAIAINHSRAAIAMHAANHPETRHYQEDIWTVDPREAAAGRVVEVAWFSPDCTHFSRAKGGQPRSKEVRGLADVVIRWARAVKPRLILLENVEEFQTWGPLDEHGYPIKSAMGSDFRAWLAALVDCGYQVEYRVLVAADYGAPTTRKRFFLVARCDGQPIVWPTPTHGRGREHGWRTASEVIDWTLPCPSIFGRKRPLADATMRRIAAGLRRYVIDSAAPFVVPLTHHGNRRAHPMGERGWRYAVEQLVTAGAREPAAGEDLRGWLDDVLPALVRPMRHDGCHRYVWWLTEGAKADAGASLPYPRAPRAVCGVVTAMCERAA